MHAVQGQGSRMEQSTGHEQSPACDSLRGSVCNPISDSFERCMLSFNASNVLTPTHLCALPLLAPPKANCTEGGSTPRAPNLLSFLHTAWLKNT
jgi:hypothetical protein